jgi:hypothetical protein
MNIWDQFKTSIPPRHPLGVWLSRRKLWTRGFVPSRKDRVPLRGRRPFMVVFGGVTAVGGVPGPVTIPANQYVELRYVCQSDFIWYASMINTTVGGTAANPGVRVQVRDLSTRPGKGKKFSGIGSNDSNFAGSAQDTRFLRKPYRFHAGHTISVKILNLQNASNNVQLVLEGVQDE